MPPLLPDQVDLFRAFGLVLFRPDLYGLTIPSGHGCGKGHDVDLVLDTPAGRKRWGDLRVGDLLFGTHGPTRITACYDRGVLPMFRVEFHDGSSCRVDGDHLWTVHERRRRTRTLGTREMMLEGAKRANGRGRTARWKLPAYAAVEYPDAAPFDPYAFGLWLGNGDGNARICCATSDTEHYPGWSWRPQRGRPGVSYASFPGLVGLVKKLGMWGCRSPQKYVPDAWREVRAADRHALLQGLLDTDGTVSPDHGAVSFCSTSERLARDVVWLARSLGGIAHEPSVKPRPFYRNPTGEKVFCSPAYTVTLTLPQSWSPFRLPRKAARAKRRSPRSFARYITAITPDGEAPVRCVTVDASDSLYLANDFIPTHNSWWLAGCGLYFHSAFDDALVVITAPKQEQVLDNLWPHIRELREQSAWLRLMTDYAKTRIAARGEVSDAWQIVPRTAKKGENIAGYHSRHKLILVDEATGVEDEIFEPVFGGLTGKINKIVLAYNPTLPGSQAWKTCEDPRERRQWIKMHLDARKCPRVTKESIRRTELKYGKDSDVVRVRIDGLWPRQAADALFSVHALEEWKKRKKIPGFETAGVGIGLDVAYTGSDFSSLKAVQGPNLIRSDRWNGYNTQESAGRAIAMVKRLRDEGLRVERLSVDVIGYGAGTFDRINEEAASGPNAKALDGIDLFPVNVAEKSSRPDDYPNLRSEFWYDLADAARDGALGYDPEHVDEETVENLYAELVPIRGKMLGTGQRKVDDKDTMRKALGHSPDDADAWMLARYEPGRGVGVLGRV